jgi:quercetin dioxygenase-like cupin family protein
MVVVAGASVVLAAQGAPMPTFMVPATREPHHTVKLENQYVRVLDVTVPAFDGTLYHIHENPYVYVSIGPATLKAQVEGSNDITDLNLKDGEVRFSPVVTHRVGNIGATPFRNITVQIQGRDTSAPAAGSGPASAAGSTVAFENELVRVDRLSLDPGKSTAVHTHPRSHLLIAVHGGSVKMEAQGYPTSTRPMSPGDFDWHTGGYTHNLTNVGTTAFDAIEIVWK